MFSSIANLAHVLAWSGYMILSLAPITYICCNVARSCFKKDAHEMTMLMVMSCHDHAL
jgi:hypothetical protein